MAQEKYLKAMLKEAGVALKKIGTARDPYEIVRAHERYKTIVEMIGIPARLLYELDPEGAKSYRDVANARIAKMETEELAKGGCDETA